MAERSPRPKPVWNGDKERERQIGLGGSLSHPHPNSILGKLSKNDPKAAKALLKEIRKAQSEAMLDEKSLADQAAA